MKKITIIVPFCNAEQYIETCINTLKKQTYQDFRVLFIDDGSTDTTVDKIMKITYLDSRFKILKQCHKGVSAARNLGLKNLEGEYIAFMDVDDELCPDYFEILVCDMEREKADIVLCNYADVYADQKKIPIKFPWENQLLKNEDIENQLLPLMIAGDKEQDCIRGCVWRTFIRTDFYKKYNIQFDKEVEIAEDLLFLLELYNKANSIYIESKILYLYYKNIGSTMNRYRSDSLKRSLNFHNKLIYLLKKEGIFSKNINRYNENRATMYTTEISNIVRSSSSSNQKEALVKLRRIYMSDNINIWKLKNLTFGRKISLVLLKYRVYYILLILYKIKEKNRLKKFSE